MPIEVTLLAQTALTVDELRDFAETFDPPFVAAETRAGGTVEFTEFDHTRVLTLGRPRRVETPTDLRRLFPEETRQLDDAGTLTDITTIIEGVLPFAQYRRGLALMFAFEEATGGKAIVKGITL
ncbi:hypothetical protein ACFY5A_16205 [Microbacterium sp. NPDC012755]|jgi:hypothetical protein|uniref:hypothetical protein n=1 Tax=Microbacterium sp. NPDC012755 TaxID=3364184 RepID=UPI0036AE036D